jgi:hypothetical protein
MNQIIKIFNSFFALFDRLTDDIDIRTRVMIRQSFTLIIVLLCIVGLIAGIALGRQAADKGGVPMVENTADVFDIEINRERERVTFSEMIDERELFEKESASLQRTTQEQSSPSFRESTDSVVDNDPAVALSPPDPIETESDLQPIERELDIDSPLDIERNVPETAVNTPEVIINEESIQPLEADNSNTTSTVNETDKQNSVEPWSPGSEDGDYEQNLVPLDNSGGIVE